MKKLNVLAGCVVLVATTQAQTTAWLPSSSELVISPTYSFQTFDEFWLGRDKVKLPDDVDQHTAWISLEYGITPRLAADAQIGYTWVTTTKAFGGSDDKDDGLADTSLGLRYLIASEEDYACPFMPTVALRGGVIIEGTYDENLPFSAGDGASGFETSLLLRKAICPGFGLYGDIGWRTRNHDVPDDLFGFGGLYLQYQSLLASVGYRHVQGLSGKDIGQVRFPEVKEITQNIEASIGIADRGGRVYQFFYAHTLDGRNTGEKDIFGASISIPLDLPH